MTTGRRTLAGQIPGDEWPRANRLRMAHKAGSGRRKGLRRPAKKRRLKRRNEIVLPSSMGGGVRLPAMPEINVGARLLTAPLLIVLLWAGYMMLYGGTFQVGQADVLGAVFMNEALVRSIAQVDDSPVFSVDPVEIAAQLEAYPEIANAEVSVEWPNRVVIQLDEREPVVAWDDGGRKWWLSDDGVAFLEREAMPGMVEIVADEPVLQIQEDPLAQVINPEILRSARQLGLLLPDAGILRFDRDHGLVLEDARGWTVYFGAEGDMAEKVRVYITIGEWLQTQALQPSMVSVVDPGSPYYTLAR
jgi:hypothetical protein